MGSHSVTQILLKQETVSGSGIGWAICKSAPLAPDSTSALSFFTGQMPFLPPNQQHQCTEGKTVCIIKKARDDGVLDAVEPYANNLHLAPDI